VLGRGLDRQKVKKTLHMRLPLIWMKNLDERGRKGIKKRVEGEKGRSGGPGNAIGYNRGEHIRAQELTSA